MRLPVAIALALGLVFLGYLAIRTERSGGGAAHRAAPDEPPTPGAVDVQTALAPALGDTARGMVADVDRTSPLRAVVELDPGPGELVLHLRLVLPWGAPAVGADVGAEVIGVDTLAVARSHGSFVAPPQGPHRVVTETDADGRSTLHLAAGTKVRLAVRHPRGTLVHEELMGAGEHTLELTLQPIVRVVGRVQSATTGEPIAGAAVSDGFGHFGLLSPARTDAEGRFELDGSASTGVVKARAEGYGEDTRRIQIDDDGSWRIWHATGAGLTPPGTELVLELPEPKRIRGTVFEPDGSPAVGARVRASGYLITNRGARAPDQIEVATDENGHFELNGLRGDLTHTVWAWDGTHGAVVGLLPAGECERFLDLRLHPPTELRGVAVELTARGEPMPLEGQRVMLAMRSPAGATVGVQTTRSELSEFLSQPIDPDFPRDGFQPNLPDLEIASNVASDGSFEFRGHAPGSVRLRAEKSYSKRDLIAPLGLHVLDEPFVVKRDW